MRSRFSLFSRLLFLILLSLCALLPGCGSKSSSGNSGPPAYDSTKLLLPSAPGTKTIGSSPLLLDISNDSQGYLTAENESEDRRMNLQLTDPEGVQYSYFVDPKEHAVIPFSGGGGSYVIVAYTQTSGSEYAALYSEVLDVTLDNEYLPFLYPNQYVNYSEDSQAVAAARELAPEDASDISLLELVYNYVVEHITYDEAKAASIEAGYLPDVDETLATGTGICFDYAALTTAMLRSRGIPCRLQIGYAGDIKHAWIDVYILSKGWVNQAIEFGNNSWTRMDPTFAASEADASEIQEYIGDGTNYTVQFTR